MVEHRWFLLLGGFMLLSFFALGVVSHRSRIPAVLLFMGLGIAAESLAGKEETVHRIAEVGIVLFFFLLGLEFPLKRMLEISKQVWPAGILDLVLNMGVSFLLALAFCQSGIQALLIGTVAYATSSSITARMLEERKRLTAPEAEFILALLIFEDLVAPVLVSVLADLHSGTEVTFSGLLLLFLRVALLTAGAALLGAYGFEGLSALVAKYLETDLMPLFVAGVALAYAGLAVALGLSSVFGAFLAGMMLAQTGSLEELEDLILPVRNLTLPFFFFWFGSTISFREGIPLVGFLVILIVWSLAAKLLVGLFGGRWYGLSVRAALRAGFSLGPRGEFSALTATLAPPPLRTFSAAYILATTLAGLLLFHKAPVWARRLQERYFPPPAGARSRR